LLLPQERLLHFGKGVVVSLHFVGSIGSDKEQFRLLLRVVAAAFRRRRLGLLLLILMLLRLKFLEQTREDLERRHVGPLQVVQKENQGWRCGCGCGCGG